MRYSPNMHIDITPPQCGGEADLRVIPIDRFESDDIRSRLMSRAAHALPGFTEATIHAPLLRETL